MLFPLLLTLSLGFVAVPSRAQQGQRAALDGYITAVRSPEIFEVQGRKFRTSGKTNYGYLGGQPIQTGKGTLYDSLQTGASVHVVGPSNTHTQVIEADTVFLRNTLDRRLSGVGVIDKIISTSPNLTFRADGYVMHLAPSSDLTFVGQLNTLTDIGTNTWIRYQGERDHSGALRLIKATFLPAKSTKFTAIPALEVDEIEVRFPHPARKEKLRYSQSETLFRVIDNPSLQDRIHSIGTSIVPAYQKALPDDDPSKINFQFYAVDSPSLRWESCTRDGMILIPKIAIDRLKRDDEIAAVLADGVAYDLQRQAARLTVLNRALFGAEMAGLLVPGLQLPSIAGSAIAQYTQLTALAKQRARIALSLLGDAGYDLKEAPEAWRLLAPGKLPATLDTLRYPDQSVYQMSEIYQQYPAASASPKPADQ